MHRDKVLPVEACKSELTADPQLPVPRRDRDDIADTEAIRRTKESHGGSDHLSHAVAGITEPEAAPVVSGRHDGRLSWQGLESAVGQPFSVREPEHPLANHGHPQATGRVAHHGLHIRSPRCFRQRFRHESGALEMRNGRRSTKPDDAIGAAVAAREVRSRLS